MSSEQVTSPQNPVSNTRPKSSKQDENLVEQQLADYGLPPTNYGLSKHHFHYGWPITPRMMDEMLVKLKIPLPKYSDFTTAAVVSHLGRLVNFRHCIHFVSCKPDEWCEDQNRVESYVHEGKEVRVVAFLSIGSTVSRAHFFRRPTQNGLDAMIKVFGENPRWMEDFLTKEEAREEKRASRKY